MGRLLVPAYSGQKDKGSLWMGDLASRCTMPCGAKLNYVTHGAMTQGNHNNNNNSLRKLTRCHGTWDLISCSALQSKTSRVGIYEQTAAWEVFGHIESVKILVILNPTGYMLTSSSVLLL